MRNSGLEAVRGLAAMIVLFSHLLTFPGIQSSLGKGTMLFQWGTASVIVFFLLSGTVIRLSFDRTPRSPRQFLLTRASRLIPLYMVAIGFSVLVLCGNSNPPTTWTIIGNLLFLQSVPNYLCPVLGSNPPLWSLAFEAFFYLAFALTIGNRQKTLLRIWVVSSIVAMTSQFLGEGTGLLGHLQLVTAYSSIWLLGYFAVDIAKHLNVGITNAFSWLGLLPMTVTLNFNFGFYSAAQHLIVATTVLPMFLSIIRSTRSRTCPHSPFSWIGFGAAYVILAALFVSMNSDSLTLSKIVYVVLPCAMTVIGLAMSCFQHRLVAATHIALFLGQVSYAIYLFHYPVYESAHMLGLSGVAGVAILLPAAIILALVAEYYIHPPLCHLLFPSKRQDQNSNVRLCTDEVKLSPEKPIDCSLEK